MDFYNSTFRSVTKKAAIGYTYDDSTPAAEQNEEDEDEDDLSSDEEIDLGVVKAYFINVINYTIYGDNIITMMMKMVTSIIVTLLFIIGK